MAQIHRCAPQPARPRPFASCPQRLIFPRSPPLPFEYPSPSRPSSIPPRLPDQPPPPLPPRHGRRLSSRLLISPSSQRSRRRRGRGRVRRRPLLLAHARATQEDLPQPQRRERPQGSLAPSPSYFVPNGLATPCSDRLVLGSGLRAVVVGGIEVADWPWRASGGSGFGCWIWDAGLERCSHPICFVHIHPVSVQLFRLGTIPSCSRSLVKCLVKTLFQFC